MNEAIVQIHSSVGKLIPELILVINACVYFLVGAFVDEPAGNQGGRAKHRWGGLTLIALAFAAYMAFMYGEPETKEHLGAFRVDQLAWFVRGLSLLTGAALLLMSWNKVDQEHVAEHHACLLLIITGVNLIALANDLIGLFLALELISISTYLLLYLGKRDRQGEEATIKYFLLSVFSSAIVLFGFSYFYGIAGTTNLTASKLAIIAGSSQMMPAALGLALVMIVAGLGFRLTAVPFHFYAPDVFQGSSITAAALLSFLPKVAGVIALIRLISVSAIHVSAGAVWTPAAQLDVALFILAAASMFIGNVMALQQTDIRRLLAWSSVAHAGYLLVGIAVTDQVLSAVRPESAVLFYLAAYGAMTVGSFAVLAMVARNGREIQTIDDLAGLGKKLPIAAGLMTIFLFGLTGLPPTVGFLGKWNLFVTAWGSQTVLGQWLAIILAVNAAIGAVYYLRVIAAMFLQAPAEGSRYSVENAPAVSVLACAFLTIALFVIPGWLWHFIDLATY